MKGYNFSIIYNYQKTYAIPRTNIKIKGFKVFFLVMLGVVIVTAPVFIFFKNETLQAITLVVGIATVISLGTALSTIDRNTNLTKLHIWYFKHIKKWRFLVADGITYKVKPSKDYRHPKMYDWTKIIKRKKEVKSWK